MPNAPIYMPENKSASSLGQGAGAILSGYITKVMEKKKQDAEMQQIQEAQEAIKAAPDRETALDMFVKLPFKTVEQMQLAKGWLDTVHPPKDTTPREVTTYDPETGAETKKFVPQGTLISMEPQTKPNVEDFYKKDKSGNIQLIGTFPQNKRPEGSVTLKELDQMRADRTAARLETEKREVTPGEDLQQLKTYNSMLGNLLNVQKVVGNEVILDFGGNKEKENAYKYAIQHSAEFRQKYPGDPNRAAFEAITAGGGFAAPAPESIPTAAAPAPKGAISSLWANITGENTTAPAATPATPKAPIVNDEYIVGKVYKNPKGAKAKYLGNGKWESVK